MNSQVENKLSLSDIRRYFKRSDYILFSFSVIALILAIWLTPKSDHTHHFVHAIQDSEAEQIAVRFVEELGYNLTDYHSLVVSSVNKNALNSFVKDYSHAEILEAYQQNPENSIPLQYLNVILYPPQLKTGVIRSVLNGLSESLSFDGIRQGFDSRKGIRFEVRMDLNGNIFSFRQDNNLDQPFTDVYKDRLSGVIDFSAKDSINVKYLNFGLLSDPDDFRSDEVSMSDSTIYIRKNTFLSLAQAYLTSTKWIESDLSFDSTSVSNDSNRGTASVSAEINQAFYDRNISTQITIDKFGRLAEIRTEFVSATDETLSAPARRQIEQLGMLTYALLVVISIIVLVRRGGRGLIDFSAAKNDSFYITIVLVVMVLLSMTEGIVQKKLVSGFDFIGTIVGVSFLALGGWFMMFSLAATASSLASEAWPRKFRQYSLIRKGHFLNQPVGFSFIYAVLFSFLIAGGVALYMAVMPINGEIYMDETVFLSQRYMFGTLFLITSGIFGGAFMMYTMLIIWPAIWYNKFKYKWVAITAIIVIMTAAGMSPIEVRPMAYTLPIFAGLGLALGLIFWRFGPITAVLSYVLFELLRAGILCIGLYGTPDFYLGIFCLLIPVTVLIVGFLGVRTNRGLDDLPDYIPPYLLEMANRQRMQRELEIARQVQLSFLPGETPEIPGLDLAANCKAAFEVGGDYYDFITLSDNKLALTIGDVSGKGIQAAFFMTLIKGFVQSLSSFYDQPSELLNRMNTLFYNNAKRGTFISLIYGILDLNDRVFRFSRAGHNPVLIMRNNAKKAEYLQNTGIALGLVNDERFASALTFKDIKLESGDILLLYTDGYTEAMNRKKELYGEDRLARVVLENKDLSAEALLETINMDVSDFAGGFTQTDDMTMLIVKML